MYEPAYLIPLFVARSQLGTQRPGLGGPYPREDNRGRHNKARKAISERIQLGQKRSGGWRAGGLDGLVRVSKHPEANPEFGLRDKRIASRQTGALSDHDQELYDLVTGYYGFRLGLRVREYPSLLKRFRFRLY